MSTSTSDSPSGSQDLISEGSLNIMPTEILFFIFECSAPKDIVRCRQVCTRWRDIIDTILHNDTKWEQFCKQDFPKTCEGAMWKTPDIDNWFEMYRTLSLWSSLDKAQESVDEFCHSENINEEIKSVAMQKKGQILVHKSCRVVYYDLLSMSVAERKGVSGQFVSLVEFDDVVIIQGLHGELRIVDKPDQDWHSDLQLVRHPYELVFHDVKSFVVQNRILFFTKYHSQMFAFNLDEKTLFPIILRDNIDELPEPIAVGIKNGCVYVLTMDKELYTYVEPDVKLEYKLDTSCNLMDCLYKHNMLDDLDWRYYYILLATLHQRRHTGLLQFISKMHIYGDDLFLVGTQSSVFNIYYKPFVDGELNLMKFPPVKSYNFSARIDIPILSVYPITNIEVVETKEGHIILVCMPRKLQVITYSNQYKTPKSTAVIPYVPSISSKKKKNKKKFVRK